MRTLGHAGPILFLSAKDEVRDRAEGLSAGADDYIVKPFSFAELVARLRTHLLRRLGATEASLVSAGGSNSTSTCARRATGRRRRGSPSARRNCSKC